MEGQHPEGLRRVSGGLLAQLEREKMAGEKGVGGNKRRGKVGLAFDPIAAALKQMHEDVASEAIPDDFMRLLDEIDERSAARKTPE